MSIATIRKTENEGAGRVSSSGTAPARRLGKARTCRTLAAMALLLTASFAIGPGTLAGNGAGEADGLVVVVAPRSGTLVDGVLVMTPIDGLYVFDFTTYTDTGDPFRFTGYNVELHSIDPDGLPGTTVYSEDATTAATFRHTVRIPTSALAWGAAVPSDGIAFTIALRYDGDGAPLHDDAFHLPAGAYNLLTARLVEEGRFAAADQADETFTPLFLVDLQPAGLVRAGNPILNPGFELSASDGTATDTFGTPPWIFFADAGGPGPSGADDQVPWSDAERVPSAGRNGHALRIQYDARDATRNVIFGQSFGNPSLPGMWYGTVDTKLRIDWRVTDPSGLVTSHHGVVGLYVVGPSGPERVGRGATIPADDTWRTTTYDYSAVAGKPLTSLWLSFNIPAPTGSALRIDIDEVRLSGVVFQTTTPRNDLNDGHASFIFPKASTAGEGGAVVQHLTRLGDGTTAYVYALAAVDHTDVAPGDVDLAATDGVTFHLLDATSFDAGGGAASGSLLSLSDATDGTRFLRLRAADGGLDPQYLVVVDPAMFSATTTSSSVVPWMHADLGAMGPDYVDTFGDLADPVSGHHSVMRNALRPFALADHLDHAATPVRLSGLVGDTVDARPIVTLLCPGVAGGDPCWAGPGQPVTVEVEVASMTAVVETTTLALTTPAGTFVRSAPVPTEGGSTTWTLSASEVEALSDPRLIARQDAAWFSLAGESATIRLDNLLPTAAFETLLPKLVVKGATARFVDQSSDLDGTIVSRAWEAHLVGDPSPDGDSDTPGLVAVGGSSGFQFTLPDDGLYEVRLEVVDNEGGVQRANVTFLAVNREPVARFDVASSVRPGMPVEIRDRSADLDGVVALAEWDLDGDGLHETVSPGAVFTRIFTTEGTLTLGLRVTDDDGTTAATTRTLVVDGTAPVTVLSPQAPAQDGWYRGAVDVLVSRADAGSGVRETRVFVDGLHARTRSGDVDFTVRVSGDGVHTLEFQSEDLAGNLEFASGTLLRSESVRIDGTAPSVRIVAPRLAGPVADAYLAGDVVTVTMAASDAASGVAYVALLVDGVVVGVDEVGGDGWSISWDTTGVAPGAHLIEARAVDIAGNDALSDRVVALVLPSPF